ncbi:MAG: hypothetical protein NDJ19_04420 [Ramlibacter sp.]|nr:hypothetical protein [Ramlibacter sp.]
MIPYDVDPSLHTAEPESQKLGDGFSPPRHAKPDAQADDARPMQPEPAPPPPRQRP